MTAIEAGDSVARVLERASASAEPAPRLRRVFVGFFLLWCLASFPALRHAWWYLDDYCQDFSQDGVAHNLGLGRPGQFLMVASFALEDHGRNPAANVLLRLAQGGLHALAGVLLGAVLYDRTRRRATLLAALPFLLSPFSGEAVLWRSASPYPLSAVLALAGLRLLHRRRGLASGLVMAAMLTQPLGAFAAAAAWCLAAAVELLDRGRAAWPALRAEAIALAIAYGAGGAAALALGATQGPPWRSRLDVALDAGARLRLLVDANALFLTRSFLSQWRGIDTLHTFFPLLGLAPAVAAALRRAPSARAAGAALFLLWALVVPYAAILPVGERDLPIRLYYLAPLLHCGAWALADHAWRGVGWLRGLAAGLLLALSCAYAVVDWAIAPVYQDVYDADLRLLRDLERQARATRAESLFVCAQDQTANPNPHGIDFRGGPDRLSAFLTKWSAEGILEWHGALPVTRDEDLRIGCCVHCDWTRSPSFRVMRLEEGPVLCGCAP